NNVGLCLIAYRGMTQDSAGNAYPLATPDVRNGQQLVISNQSLSLSGRYGAWRNYLRAYFYFRDQTQAITQPLLLPASILATIPLHRSVTLSLEDQVRRSYLISKLEARAPGLDGKVFCQLEVLTIPPVLSFSDEPDNIVVWVDLVLGEKRPQNLPVIVDAVGTYPVWLQTVTIRCWKDSARTLPASVTNLAVKLRQHREGNAISPVQEYVNTYLVNGIFTLVENDFVSTENLYQQPTRIDIYNRTIAIDPGEGYTIIP
ncbi:hypothetical protein, partial [Spirosoma harenae]